MTSPDTQAFDFDLESQAQQTNDQQWQLTLTPHWNINTNPNGGYLLACLLRCMSSMAPLHPDPISVTTHYLRPGLANQTATLTGDIIRIGKRTATITGSMAQQGKTRITTTATFGVVGRQDLPAKPGSTERSLTISPPLLPPPDECLDRQALAQGVDLGIASRVDVRIDPQYAAAGQSPLADIAGWIRFKDNRPADVMALAVFCDAFPPAIFSLYGRIGWVPTVELALHVRQRPEPGWIKALFTTRDVANNLFIEDGLLWDQANNLVAQSRQLQMILQT